MTHRNAISRALRALALTFLPLVMICAPAIGQQDITVVSGTNPYIVLARGVQWAGSGFGNIGNNFIFTPTSPDEGFCLFVSNNNPSSSHSFTVAVHQTGDPAQTTYQSSQGKWTTVPTQSTFPVSVSASSVVGINYKTTASAGIAVTISGNSSAAGSPDTADLFAVQTTASSCGALAANSVQGVYQQGTNVTLSQTFPVLVGGLQSPGTTGFAEAMHLGTNGNGLLLDGGTCCQSWASGFITPGNISSATFSKVAAAFSNSQQSEVVMDVIPIGSLGNQGWGAGFVRTNFLEEATDQQFLTQSGQKAFQIFGRVVNPTANATILHNFNGTTSAVNPAYKNLLISCSAACEVFINRTSALGTTCTALTIRNMQLGNGGTVQAAAAGDVAENACATQPTVTYQMYDIQLASGTTYTVDLSGFVNFHNAGSGSGLSVIANTGITGNIAATLTYMEQ